MLADLRGLLRSLLLTMRSRLSDTVLNLATTPQLRRSPALISRAGNTNTPPETNGMKRLDTRNMSALQSEAAETRASRQFGYPAHAILLSPEGHPEE